MICLLVPQMVEGFFIFNLNNNRKGLVLKGILTDKIALDKTESEDILFAEGLSIITDLKQGPDGYPYIVISGLKQSKTTKFGAVFRIVPSDTTNTNDKLDFLNNRQKRKKSNTISTINNISSHNHVVPNHENSHPKKKLKFQKCWLVNMDFTILRLIVDFYSCSTNRDKNFST